MRAINCTRGTCLADDVRVARSWWSRFRGLMLGPPLAPGQALWIERCRSIHTHFVRFPIDAIFLDRHGVVVAAVQAMAPWRIGRYYPRAESVLELPAGVVSASGTEEGDQIRFENET